MSFVEELNQLPFGPLLERARHASTLTARRSVETGASSLSDFANLISPGASEHLEELGRRSRLLTQQRFGKVIRLFAPLYLSNECINNCQYCGFSRDNPILRVTLSREEILSEARELKRQGFRNLLLVAGEHPKFVSGPYLSACVRSLRDEMPGVSLEAAPLETADYRPIVEAGAEGLVVYQETYDRAVYGQVHTSGPKKDFDWRLQTPERAYTAGFRRLGVGALYGLADWRRDALCVAAHASYLLRRCWKASLTISVPRLRPCAGNFQPLTEISDRDLVQLVCAFRLFLPDVGLALSTREPARLRNGLIPLGITLMSAGSHTEPGGYTGAGREKAHLTQRGRLVSPANSSEWAGDAAPGATRQFEIADERPADRISEKIRDLGYEPVWKDWDAALTA